MTVMLNTLPERGLLVRTSAFFLNMVACAALAVYEGKLLLLNAFFTPQMRTAISYRCKGTPKCCVRILRKVT